LRRNFLIERDVEGKKKS